MMTVTQTWAPKAGDSSPWGRIDYARQIADGIVSVGTPSHGGIWLSPQRAAQVDPRWGVGEPSWLEEDCAWAIAAYTFPEEFRAAYAVPATEQDLTHDVVAKAQLADRNPDPAYDVVASSKATLKQWLPDEWMAITGETIAPGESRKLDVRRLREANPASLWIGSSFGDWCGLVPQGHVLTFPREGPDLGSSASAVGQILLKESDYEAAQRNLSLIGPASAAYELYPECSLMGVGAIPYAVSDLLREMGSPGVPREKSIERLASWKPPMAGLVLAKEGRFAEAVPLLAHCDASEAEVRNGVLWLASRAGDVAAVQALIEQGADVAWSNGIAATAARFHGHSAVAELLEAASADLDADASSPCLAAPSLG